MSSFSKLYSTQADTTTPILDGYTPSSHYLDRDLRLLLTHMDELSRDPFYLNQKQRLKRVGLIQKSITPAMAIEFFLYRKCSQSFLKILFDFCEKNAALIPDFKKILTTYSPYRKMCPTDVLINRRLGISMDFDRDSLNDSKWFMEPTQKVFLQEKSTDKKDSLLFLQYIHHVLKLEIPFSNQQIQNAFYLEDKALLKLVPATRLNEAINTIYQKGLPNKTIKRRSFFAYYLTYLNQEAHPFLKLNLDSFSSEKLNALFSSNALTPQKDLFEKVIDKTCQVAQNKTENPALYQAYLTQLKKLMDKYTSSNTIFLINQAFIQKNADVADILLTHNPTFPQKNLIREYTVSTDPAFKAVLEKHILKKEKSVCKKQVKKFILKHSFLHPRFLNYVKTKTK